MDVDDIVAKQLKQMEKEMREKETKLRTQEKKVCLPVGNAPIHVDHLITALSRLTTGSEPSGWWRYHCWKSSISSR